MTNTFYHAGMIFWNAASTISSFGFSAVMSLGIITSNFQEYPKGLFAAALREKSRRFYFHTKTKEFAL